VGLPLGRGERRHPRGGNTLLTTMTVEGNKRDTPLWISQFATDLNLQLDSAQVKTGLIHRPIRMTERFLVFSTLWNVADREKYVRLIDTLRQHWAFNLNENRLTPMRLRYYGGNKTWHGFIENAAIGYAVTDVVLTYQFQMRLIPSITGPISRVSGKSPFSPTAQDAKNFGTEWYKQGEFIAEFIGTGNEGRGGNSQKNDPITGGSGGGRKRR